MFQAMLAMVLAGAAPAAAIDDWTFVDGSADYSMMTFVDKDSIQTNGSNATGTVYTVLANDSDSGAAAYIVRLEFGCSAKQSRILSMRVIDGQQKVVLDTSDVQDWQAVEQDTVNGSVMKYICSKGASETDPVSLGANDPFVVARGFMREQRAKQ